MEQRWQRMTAQELEAAYNPRVAVPDAQEQLARRAAQSAMARERLLAEARCDADVRYGPGPKETLDLYRPLTSAGGAPLALFIHGGYWRALDKHDHSFVVPPLLAMGAVVANVNYDLCPEVTLTEMSAEIVRAVRFCHARAGQWGADPSRLVLIGHSAGAHLAARVLNAAPVDGELPADRVAGVAAISGIYEPEIVTRISVNQEAQIDLPTARENDCLANPPRGNARVIAWAGGDEPEPWIEQTRAYARTVRAAGLRCEQFVLEGSHHFTVLPRSADPGPGRDALQRLLDEARLGT